MVEQVGEQGCGQAERWIRDDPESLAGERDLPEVGLDDLDTSLSSCPFDPSMELRDPRRVSFDGQDSCPHRGKRKCQGSVPRPDLDDQLSRLYFGRPNEPIDLRRIGEEILPELASPGVAGGAAPFGGHGPSRSQSCHAT